MDDETKDLLRQLRESCQRIATYQVHTSGTQISKSLDVLKGYLYIAEMQIEEIQKQVHQSSSPLL